MFYVFILYSKIQLLQKQQLTNYLLKNLNSKRHLRETADFFSEKYHC